MTEWRVDYRVPPAWRWRPVGWWSTPEGAAVFVRDLARLPTRTVPEATA